MTRVLVTAFEPFGGETVNPSQQAVQTLSAGPAPAGVELVTAFCQSYSAQPSTR